MRRAATSKPSASKICDPMWEWMPTRSSRSSASQAASASAAAPPAIEKPNFWSSCAVEMYSWVCASTPVVTLTITRGRTPRSPARRPRRPISSKESTMIRPTPASRAWTSSAMLLLLPCSPTVAGSTPARWATASSPPVQVSMPSPSSLTQRATAVHRKDLPA